MKILVAIANYGTRNVAHVRKLIATYQAMQHDVHIVVLSEAPKDLGPAVEVLVGLPTKNPWSLPFGHRNLFVERQLDYDLFIYSEDDIEITERNIGAFLEASARLGSGLLPGFVRFERYPDGTKNYTDIHGPYSWIPDSVSAAGPFIYARLSNDHSACYMLTREQLEAAIHSGGFLVAPHEGKYDLLCSAATDPYTQCGFTRVICLSHLHDFEVRHLSDAYVQKKGLIDNNCAVVDGYRQALLFEALMHVSQGKRQKGNLFLTGKALPTVLWNKLYFEDTRSDLLALIPDHCSRILSVGCGWGATEAELVRAGKDVTAIPLDSVIARLAEAQGVTVTEPNFPAAFETLRGHRFDVVLVSDVLQHLDDPVDILRQLRGLLATGGSLVGSVPNLCAGRRWAGSLCARDKRRYRVLGNDFATTRLHLTTKTTTARWLQSSGFRDATLRYANSSPGSSFRKAPMIQSVSAPEIVFVARQTSRPKQVVATR